MATGNVEVDTQKAIRQLTRYADNVRKETVKLVRKTTLNIETGAKRNAPVDMGRLQSSIRGHLFKAGTKPSGMVRVVVHYAPFVEFGTKQKVDVPPDLESYAIQFKGTGGGSFDELLENIESWASRHGMPQSAAYPIAVEIAEKGVDAQPFLFPAARQEAPKFINGIVALLNQTGQTSQVASTSGGGLNIQFFDIFVT